MIKSKYLLLSSISLFATLHSSEEQQSQQVQPKLVTKYTQQREERHAARMTPPPAVAWHKTDTDAPAEKMIRTMSPLSLEADTKYKQRREKRVKFGAL